MTKLFWADSVARRNYEIYGDAVSFDATFDTNKYAFLIINFSALYYIYWCFAFCLYMLCMLSIGVSCVILGALFSFIHM